ncbi:MAG: signal peptidase I [Dehalococcoidia bacterium]|nr:signal peptidase I [Dehalococcoidia bacterium]
MSTLSHYFSTIGSSIKELPAKIRASRLWREFPWRDILVTIIFTLIVYCAISFSLQNTEVTGPSMEPSLHNGERVLINKLAYRFGGEPQRGDIIVFISPEQPEGDVSYVKRVIGLPGERVKIENGYVYIIQADGTEIRLDEDYLPQPMLGYYVSGVIPEDHYFVLGDNRNNSADSRHGWTVPKSDILGKAWIVIWPPSEWGSAPNQKVGATS